MGWTAPRTWVVGEVLTAALLNQELRDHLLETGPAKVATAEDLLVGAGGQTLKRLAKGASRQVLRVGPGGALEWSAAVQAQMAVLAADRSNTSTSLVDVDAAAQSISMTTEGGPVLVAWSGAVENSGNGYTVDLTYSVDGVDRSIIGAWVTAAPNQRGQVSFLRLEGGLSPGSHAFRARFRASGYTAKVAGSSANAALVVVEFKAG